MNIPSTLIFSSDSGYERPKTVNTEELTIYVNPPNLTGNLRVKVLEIHHVANKVFVWSRLNQVMNSKAISKDRGFTDEITVNVPKAFKGYKVFFLQGVTEKEFKTKIEEAKKELDSAVALAWDNFMALTPKKA